MARALATARKREASEAAADFSVIDRALLDIKRRLEQFEDVTTWAQTVKSSGEKIEKRIRAVKEALAADLEHLEVHVGTLKSWTGRRGADED